MPEMPIFSSFDNRVSEEQYSLPTRQTQVKVNDNSADDNGASSEKQSELKRIFANEPDLDDNESSDEVQRWKNLGALNFEDLVRHMEGSFRSDLRISTIKKSISNDSFKIYVGQVNQLDREEGLGRQIFKDEDGILISEGQFKNGVVNGYARVICPKGSAEDYYIGMLKLGCYDGKGKLVYKDGQVEDGNFDLNEFVKE